MLKLPGAKSFAWCNVPSTPHSLSSMFVCFPISSCLPLLRVSLRVGLYHIMLPLFWCSQFILLPCHPIMCRANRVLLSLCSKWVMELSHLQTCVSVCSLLEMQLRYTRPSSDFGKRSLHLLFFWLDGAVSLLHISCLLSVMILIFHSLGFIFLVNSFILYFNEIALSLG